MQLKNDTTWNTIMASTHSTEVKAVINGVTYGEEALSSVSVTNGMMDKPTIGNCISAQLDMVIAHPYSYIFDKYTNAEVWETEEEVIDDFIPFSILPTNAYKHIRYNGNEFLGVGESEEITDSLTVEQFNDLISQGYIYIPTSEDSIPLYYRITEVTGKSADRFTANFFLGCNQNLYDIFHKINMMGNDTGTDETVYRRDDRPDYGYYNGYWYIYKNRYPQADIPKMAQIDLYTRVTDGTNNADWIRKGIFYIDTRSTDKTTGSVTITAYDAMLKAEQKWYGAGAEITGEWPTLDTNAVSTICSRIGVTLDSRTVLNKGLYVNFPSISTDDEDKEADTLRETLGYLAVAYGGNWVITDEGKLRLISLLQASPDTVNVGSNMSQLENSANDTAVARAIVTISNDTAYYCYKSGNTYYADDEQPQSWSSDNADVFTCSYDGAAILNTSSASTADHAEVCKGILASIYGYVNVPYTASNCVIDPRAEIGDALSYLDGTSILSYADTTFDALYTSTVKNDSLGDIEHEYETENQSMREVQRNISKSVASIKLDVDEIALEVQGKIDDQEAHTLIQQGIQGITISASAGINQSTIRIKSGGVTFDTAVVSFSHITADSIDLATATITGSLTSNNIDLYGNLTVYKDEDLDDIGGYLGYTTSTLDGDAGIHMKSNITGDNISEVRCTENGAAMASVSYDGEYEGEVVCTPTRISIRAGATSSQKVRIYVGGGGSYWDFRGTGIYWSGTGQRVLMEGDV